MAIPLLPEPTRGEVTIAYLLFRIADTFEDADGWPRADRLAALEELGALIENADFMRAKKLADRWLARPPSEHDGYLDLLAQTPAVIAALGAVPAAARKILAHHTLRTVRGMSRIVSLSDQNGRLALATIEELRQYCYIVAGIVGELLTDLFLHDAPQLARRADVLHATKVIFGEALQLVNILRDSDDDAHGGRRYLPAGRRGDVMALAVADVDEASRYVEALAEAGAPRGLVAFTAFLLLLARSTLDRVEAQGPGAKVARVEVKRLVEHVVSSPVDRILRYPA